MSSIEWTDETWNPVAGCTRASRGCDNCYSVTMTHRLGEMARADRDAGRNPGRKAAYEGLTVLNPRGDRHFNGTVRCIEEALSIPFGWKRPRRVFVNSMSDLFHPEVPFGWVMRVLNVIARTPHTYQILTKRPERMRQFWEMWDDLSGEDAGAFRDARGPEAVRAAHPSGRAELFAQMLETMGDPPPGAAYPTFDWCEGMIGWGRSVFRRLWLGTSVEDQAAADERIPHLLRCPAAVRFLSCEPLLGPVDLSAYVAPGFDGMTDTPYTYNAGLHWVIVGGESGAKARPCNVAWLRSIVEQCRGSSVPCFVKQLGARPVDAREARHLTCASLDKCRDTGHAFSDDGGDPVLYPPVSLKDKKGADPSEWPADLRVQEFPVCL